MTFFDKLNQAITKNGSLLCVGLDPDISRMPERVNILDFNKAIIKATSHLVCAYKPNFAFYEALGVEGWQVLQDTIDYIPDDIPVIADAKRGDIGSTAQAYAKAIFDEMGFDAVTVNPYLGYDAVEPFLNYEDRGIYILCHTSNPGAADFQDLRVKMGNTEGELYQVVARKAAQWNKKGNVGLVVGGTYPGQMKIIRQEFPDMPFLVPGVGTQGGDLKTVLTMGTGSEGNGLIVSVSRQILYASEGGSGYAKAAEEAAATIVGTIHYIQTSLDNHRENRLSI